MRYTKILAAITMSLSVLLLGLCVLSQAKADMTVLDSLQQPVMSPASQLENTVPLTIEIWLMPDFEKRGVWVDGEVRLRYSEGNARYSEGGWEWMERGSTTPTIRQPSLSLSNDCMTTTVWPVGSSHHFFGWWEGSQVVSISHRLEGAYELQLPSLDLQPEDVLNIHLVSGVILTDSLLLQSHVPISPTSAQTGTLGATPNSTPTTALDALPAPVLTDSYTSTGAVPTTSLPFSYTVAIFGDYSLLMLENVSRPITLAVPFYPFEKAIDLTLTPLLVETVMPHSASATGGRVHEWFVGAEGIAYDRVGLLGQGEIRLHSRTVEGDSKRSAIALVSAFRRYRQEVEETGGNYWEGGLDHLLERHLDFPSFPQGSSRGELNGHKSTIVRVLTGDIRHIIQSQASRFTLRTPFQFHVWRVKEWVAHRYNAAKNEYVYYEPDRPPLKPDCECEDSNEEDEDDEQVLQMRLGRIILGPQDILSVTIKSAVWMYLDPLPDKLVDSSQKGSNGAEGSGFTAIYRGPRSFWLDIRYTPHPTLIMQQSAAMIRGYSRIHESRLGSLWSSASIRASRLIRNLNLPPFIFRMLRAPEIIFAAVFFLILWILYQLSIPNQQWPDWLIKLLSKRRGKTLKGETDSTSSAAKATEPEGNQGWREGAHALRKGIVSSLKKAASTLVESALVKRVVSLLKKATPALIRSALLLAYLSLLLAFAYAGNWGYFVETSILSHIIPDSWQKAPMPFAIMMISGGLCLLRFDTLCYRRGWLLVLVVAPLSFFGDLWLNSQYPVEVQKALNNSSATGILSGATSLAALFETLFLLGMLLWWARHQQLKREDLHAFVFAALAAATFEVTDSSLFAVALLFAAWLLFSLLLGTTDPLKKGQESEGQNLSQRDTLEKSSTQQKDTNDPLEKGQEPEGQNPLEHGTPEQLSTQQKGAMTQNAEEKQDGAPSPGSSSDPPPRAISGKLDRLWKPMPVGALLAIAVVLSQDPLLRTQLASFARSAPIEKAWTIWLDLLARLATTLVPCLAIVILMVLLDACLEHWDRSDSSLDTLLKVVPLAVVLFSTFVLGIGGLFLFTGALGLKLSDRIIYYVTVPLLTGIWLDLTLPKELKWNVVWEQLKNNLVNVKTGISVLLALLSILAPRIVSPVTPGQIDAVIDALQRLQFSP